jgi:signal transduction histidine kinase
MLNQSTSQPMPRPTRETTAADLRAELGSEDLPRHIALFYRSSETQLTATRAFLAEGLQSGHRCVYLLDVNTAADIKSALGKTNVDVQQRIDAGDLVIREADEIYLESGFNPDEMIATLEDEAQESVVDGYEGLWVAGENSWCFHTDESFDHILDFEADFDATCPDLPVTALCQYDLDRFDGTAAAKALRTHKQIVYDDQVCENPFYIPPEDYRSTDTSDLDAKLMLDQARSLTNARRDVTEREQRLDIVNRVLRHNVRNDLNLVKGTLELVNETESLPADRHQQVETAIEHAEAVIEIAEKARHVQQTLEGQRVEPQQLGPLVETAIDDVATEHAAADIEFSGTDDVMALADVNLDVALREAIENGVVHQETDEPSVVVSVSTPNEDTAQIEIRNEGEIPDLERYALEEGAETPLEHSSGLGLWLVKWIVENAHGSIRFPDSASDEARLLIELYRVPS